MEIKPLILNSELIRFIRRTANVTQQEFADKVGYSKAYIGYLEQGARPITEIAEMKIMNAFNITEENVIDYKFLIQKMN